MFSEEEPELRDLIIQNLENCGFLNKIKAELRAGVFLALEEDGSLRRKIPLFNEKFDNFVVTSEGKFILSLVREFLVYFNLDFTLSVFDPEIASSTACFSRTELCDQLSLKSSETNGPIISELLKDIISDRKKNFPGILSNEIKTAPVKSVAISNETETEKIHHENTFTLENRDLNKKKPLMLNSLETDSMNRSIKDDMKEAFDNPSTFLQAELDDVVETTTDIPVGKDNGTKSGSQSEIFNKESKDMISSDHDPFFDEPVPSEKSFFNFSDTLKEKSESKSASNIKRDLDDSKRSSLSSLKDLPSLTANHEWTFSRDPLSNFPSLDLLKSPSTEASNEKTVNLDSKENFEKKDSDIADSNEDSSEKQISEESIEEQLEDDFSAGMDDLLNSSLSLGDDVTTDQTVSQVSVVDGVDHIEPCNS